MTWNPTIVLHAIQVCQAAFSPPYSEPSVMCTECPICGMQVVDGPDELSKEAQRNGTLLFFTHLRATFASKRVLREYKLTPEAFDWILGEVETRFNQVCGA